LTKESYCGPSVAKFTVVDKDCSLQVVEGSVDVPQLLDAFVVQILRVEESPEVRVLSIRGRRGR
jgi:hypothetical protein